MSDKREIPDSPKMTSDEFIQKTKAMLSLIMDKYAESVNKKYNDGDESEANLCPRCGGFTQIEQGGYTVDCTTCRGTGTSNEYTFDAAGFIDFMEHSVMFGDEPFLDLITCEIINKPTKQNER